MQKKQNNVSIAQFFYLKHLIISINNKRLSSVFWLVLSHHTLVVMFAGVELTKPSFLEFDCVSDKG